MRVGSGVRSSLVKIVIEAPVARVEVEMALRGPVEVGLLEDEGHAQDALPEVDRGLPVGAHERDVVDALALELSHARSLGDGPSMSTATQRGRCVWERPSSMSETVTIPARFNGPLDSGNGGYSTGAFASLLGGAATVSLRAPVPLDDPLEVVRDDAHALQVLHGENLIAEAHLNGGVDIRVPAPVSVDEARAARTRYRGHADGIFCQCFVCGLARRDCFEVFAGSVAGRGGVVATPWTPPEWTANARGHVRREFVWAALDCPTYFALYDDRAELPLSFLARLSARIDVPLEAGVEHVVMAWPIEYDGRKHRAGCAVLSAEGEPLAVADALLIGPRED